MKHVIMEIGGRRFTGQDVDYMQANVGDLVSVILDYLSQQANHATPLVIFGVQFVDTGTTITASAGWIYWEGEVYEFVQPPSPIVQTGLTNVKLYRTEEADAVLAYKDAEDVRDIQVKKYITLGATSWVDANIDVADRILVADLAPLGTQGWQTLASNGDSTASNSQVSSSVFQYRKSGKKVELWGGLQCSSNSTLIVAATLPVGFRPSRSQYFTIGEILFFVATNGQITRVDSDATAAIYRFDTLVFNLD